jgi:hypothetical protein
MGEERNAYRILVRTPFENGYLGKLVDGMIILRCVLGKSA